MAIFEEMFIVQCSIVIYGQDSGPLNAGGAIRAIQNNTRGFSVGLPAAGNPRFRPNGLSAEGIVERRLVAQKR